MFRFSFGISFNRGTQNATMSPSQTLKPHDAEANGQFTFYWIPSKKLGSLETPKRCVVVLWFFGWSFGHATVSNGRRSHPKTRPNTPAYRHWGFAFGSLLCLFSGQQDWSRAKISIPCPNLGTIKFRLEIERKSVSFGVKLAQRERMNKKEAIGAWLRIKRPSEDVVGGVLIPVDLFFRFS